MPGCRAHETIQLKAGRVVFNQGALADSIRTVAEGGSRWSASDRAAATVGPLFGLPRSATVRARTDAAVIGYSVPAFRQRLGAAAGPGLNKGRELARDWVRRKACERLSAT
jgi:putative ABC transport system ATP-binding protein